MVAPMRGFSDHPAELDVEIGHRLGLRWFRIDEERHGGVSVTADININGPATVRCGCGSVAIVGQGSTGTAGWINWDEWIAAHHKLRTGLSLHGAVGKWQPGENVATCKYPDAHERSGGVPGEVPHEQCGCGFWAYWELGVRQVQPPTVAAVIKGYGDIIEGNKGFRCSHAKILAVVPTAYDPTTALNLEDAGYAVYSSLGAMLEMIKAPEGQPSLKIAPTTLNEGPRGGAGGNSSFHALGGSPSATWHAGGVVTYGGSNAGVGGAGGAGVHSSPHRPYVSPNYISPNYMPPAKPDAAELKRLRRNRLVFWDACKDLADAAAVANRDFTARERVHWDDLNAAMDACDRKIKELLERAVKPAASAWHSSGNVTYVHGGVTTTVHVPGMPSSKVFEWILNHYHKGP